MGRVSQWAVRRPWYALLTWVVLMAAIIFASIAWGGEYNDDFELPNTESTTAQDLLGELSGTAGTGAGLEGQVVWSPESGSVNDAATEEAMTELLTEVSDVATASPACSRPTTKARQLGAAAHRRRRTNAAAGRRATGRRTARRGAVPGSRRRVGALRAGRRQPRRHRRLRDGDLRG